MPKITLWAPCAALIAALALPAMQSATAEDAAAPATVLFEADRDGNVTSGSLDALLAAVRAGEAIRVGWQLPVKPPGEDETLALEHWADAGFVTIWRGQVFAQLHDIYEQGIVIDAPALHIEPKPHGWTALVGTTGLFEQAFSGEKSQMRASTKWAVAR